MFGQKSLVDLSKIGRGYEDLPYTQRVMAVAGDMFGGDEDARLTLYTVEPDVYTEGDCIAAANEAAEASSPDGSPDYDYLALNWEGLCPDGRRAVGCCVDGHPFGVIINPAQLPIRALQTALVGVHAQVTGFLMFLWEVDLISWVHHLATGNGGSVQQKFLLMPRNIAALAPQDGPEEAYWHCAFVTDTGYEEVELWDLYLGFQVAMNVYVQHSQLDWAECEAALAELRAFIAAQERVNADYHESKGIGVVERLRRFGEAPLLRQADRVANVLRA